MIKHNNRPDMIDNKVYLNKISLVTIKNILWQIISQYEQNNATSTDFYHSSITYHPMADGKYLSTISELFSTNLLSISMFKSKLAIVCKRLANSASSIPPDCPAWGLNFPHGGRPADEPYLITTSLILHGLNMCHDCCDTPPDCLVKLRGKTLQTVTKWLRDYLLPNETFARFSPHMDDCIYNPTATAAAAISEVSPENTSEKFFEAIILERLPHMGWTYGPNSHVIDMLHNAYILNALPVEYFQTIWVDDLLGQFWTGNDFCDTFRFYPQTMQVKRKRNFYYRSGSTGLVEIHNIPARLWSLGELLVLLCKAARQDVRFLSAGQNCAELICKRFQEGSEEFNWSRYATHAMHGLAAYLNLKRTLAKEISSSAMPTQTVEESSQKC